MLMDYSFTFKPSLRHALVSFWWSVPVQSLGTGLTSLEVMGWRTLSGVVAADASG